MMNSKRTRKPAGKQGTTSKASRFALTPSEIAHFHKCWDRLLLTNKSDKRRTAQ